jgi:hypothetical protein
MGPHNREHIIFNYAETAQSCCNKEGIWRDKSSLPSY